jgi:hypothetical protein
MQCFAPPYDDKDDDLTVSQLRAQIAAALEEARRAGTPERAVPAPRPATKPTMDDMPMTQYLTHLQANGYNASTPFCKDALRK